VGQGGPALAWFVSVAFVPVYLPLPAKSYISIPDPISFLQWFINKIFCCKLIEIAGK